MDARHRAKLWVKILGRANLRFPMFRISELPLLLKNRISYLKEAGLALQLGSRGRVYQFIGLQSESTLAISIWEQRSPKICSAVFFARHTLRRNVHFKTTATP